MAVKNTPTLFADDPSFTTATKKPQRRDRTGGGLSIERRFSKPGVHPFDEITWEQRTALITSEKGEVVFEQKDAEFPDFWSATATSVVASKYFHGKAGSPERERSVKQVVDRVARTITDWGTKDRYFASEQDAAAFYAELTYLLVNQYASFNSPVWFNVGVEPKPQCSACFINSVKDTMESILGLAKTEGLLFKFGSGTGSNLSTLRSSREALSGGGTPSGPVSFMRGFDAFAGVIKSGGKTRRAAKMVILNIDHPDILEFIRCKAYEEKKAWALIDAGYDGGFNVPGGAYDSIAFQNANHSVRVTDDFMWAALSDKEWHTHAVLGGKAVDTFRARDLLKEIADSAWVCGDPGMQYHTTVNNWHTCPNSAPINASNPCSEYMFIDDSACNLSSVNLMKFRREDGELDIERFRHAVDILITAMEIIVDNSSYPTPAIARNSHDFRALGLGYANLGALLMARGLPYDSNEGRAYTAAVTALMGGEAYRESALIAEAVGTFPAFEQNREPMLNVIQKHWLHIERIGDHYVPGELLTAAREAWNSAYTLGKEHGFRNAQTTLLAPTGTIGFMMDCDTTGIEPDIAIVKYKKLVGGGMMKITNGTIPLALRRLGYNDDEIGQILGYIDKNDTIEGAPGLRETDLPVFDCAFKPVNGTRSIHYMGHIKMMAASQPFLSGAISKTINLPSEATPDDIMQAYIEAWKLGLKAIAVYRDGSKRTQPVSTSLEEKKPVWKPYRHRLPDERQAITHKLSIAGHEGYITIGMYDDGKPGELFITMSKEGSTISGLMDGFATAVSLALQYGVPLKVLVDKFSHMRFEPSGFTNNERIPIAKSVCDYIFRWLAMKFLPQDEQPTTTTAETTTIAPILEKIPLESEAVRRIGDAAGTASDLQREREEKRIFRQQADAPPCSECGSIMVRSGSCYKCLNCGATSGCS